MEPVKKFPDTLNPVKFRFGRPESAPGIGPLREFRERSRKFKLVKLPSSAGIVPFKKFLERSRTVNKDRFPREGGIGPDS